MGATEELQSPAVVVSMTDPNEPPAQASVATCTAAGACADLLALSCCTCCTHLLPCDAVVTEGALHNQQLGPVDVWVAVLLKQLTTGVTSEGHLRDLCMGGGGQRRSNLWF